MAQTEQAVDGGQQDGNDGKHEDLPELDPEVEPEQRNDDGAIEQGAEVIGKPGAVNQAEDCREMKQEFLISII